MKTLKEHVVTEGVDKLHTDNLGIHHAREGAVTVGAGLFDGQVTEVALVIEGCKARGDREIVRLAVSGENEDVGERVFFVCVALGASIADKVEQEGGLTKIAREHDNLVALVGGFGRDGSELLQYRIEMLKIGAEELLVAFDHLLADTVALAFRSIRANRTLLVCFGRFLPMLHVV